MLLATALTLFFVLQADPTAAQQGTGNVRSAPAHADLTADAPYVMSIQERIQWDEAFGYCGETALQTAALYWGTYVSAWTVRDMYSVYLYWMSETEGVLSQRSWHSQYLIRTRNDPVASALRLQHFPFMTQRYIRPQYQSFMQWMKAWILAGGLVIFALFVKGYEDDEYDHIALAFGVQEGDGEADERGFNENDTLLWNPLQEGAGTTRAAYRFGDLNGTRSWTNNGTQTEMYMIPHQVNFGMAIRYVWNEPEELRRVSLELQPAPVETPSLSACDMGETCFQPGENLRLSVTANDLNPGVRYSLLRFDGPSQVPWWYGAEYCGGSGSWGSEPTRRWDFEASGESHTVVDFVDQLDVAFYRCVPECEVPEGEGPFEGQILRHDVNSLNRTSDRNQRGEYYFGWWDYLS
uniref:Uncharacterized protein n=1 Tax=Chromera velia CCMP2878 TaxID=1169474 RepID=A0A0G4I617_9ALVE|eukprot:Cvel_11272.t1-p1 / transcript=Cvel_11272.t1 / gene=Cvel_11272 / organism=Chromera_velia_CCMP2878 / gene_product=hypothetical protein / transcript_product=hypothetical protein / location=Cvel_scaffold703:6352-8757(+) / protein_length=407 / sequence_SO=supercontig / SO=protein_coding / is_pseudo=false